MIPALLTRESRLFGALALAFWLWGERREGSYRPNFSWTIPAAAAMDSSLLTSRGNTSRVPGRLRDWSSATAALPRSSDRAPSKMCDEASCRSCAAISKPIPALPERWT